MDDALSRLDDALARARRRLRLRRAVALGSVGLQVGLGGAIAAALALKLTGIAGPALAAAAAAIVAVAGAAAGGAIGALSRGLDRRSLALLVDRVGGTDELVLTALHVAGTDDPNREAILERARALALPDLVRGLPLRAPRHLRLSPLVAALAALACFAPPIPSWTYQGAPASVVVEEGERLEERLEELAATEEGAELPEDIERELAELADDLKGDSLSPEEALQRLDELEEQLSAFEQSMQESTDLLADLEQAARELDSEATDRLQESLENGDLDGAADAARDLSESLAEATPEERQRAADAMERAGERLERSGDPSLQQAGKAMKKASEQIAGEGEQSPTPGPRTDGQSGEPGQQAGGKSGSMTAQQAEQLARDLQQARDLGERLQRDQQVLERAQQMQGAMEGSRQRLGGAEGPLSQGESSQDGGASSSVGEGGGPSSPGNTDGQSGAGNQTGTAGHTWEDQGPGPVGSGQQQERASERTGGTHIDDFEKLYEAVRIDDADALLAGASGQIDARGQIDELSLRLTQGEERATTSTVALPEAYREAAAEAIEAEPIPPAYRQAVKDYFDDMQ